jgi:hypothetical protein
MRKLKIIEHISLDGVIQAPGSRMRMATTHTTDGRCPIAIPPREKRPSRRTASPLMLLGRCTYDIWSGFKAMDTATPHASRIKSRVSSIVEVG